MCQSQDIRLQIFLPFFLTVWQKLDVRCDDHEGAKLQNIVNVKKTEMKLWQKSQWQSAQVTHLHFLVVIKRKELNSLELKKFYSPRKANH